MTPSPPWGTTYLLASGIFSAKPEYVTQYSVDLLEGKKMTKKTSSTATPQQATAPTDESVPVRICFERIIPDHLDPEAHVRRSLRGAMLGASPAATSGDEVIRVARMAVMLSKKWAPGTVLRCRFLDGSPTMRKKVKAVALGWEKTVNLKLKFVSSGPADIRISFYADSGSWSAVGRDALNTSYFPLHQPTMNFGWLRDDTDDAEYSRVVLHEFGHAFGCLHEHQSPKFARIWNRTAVMKYFQGPPNFWSPEEIESNVLQKYPMNGISATDYDDASIMLYAFDSKLFMDNLGPTNTNSKLSPKDVTKMQEMYPRPSK